MEAAAIDNSLAMAWQGLEAACHSGRPFNELAFYGGTFTALDSEVWQKCLAFARGAIRAGFISGFRCSTRPDELADKRLEDLAANGCKIIELGIQSFDSRALDLCKRAYAGEVASAACQKVRSFGFGLGVQLLPGMPGTDREIFLRDLRQALESNADFLRLYPCVVIRSTALARLWEQGSYKPWSLEESLENLSDALLYCQERQVPVVRIGLAPEKDLEASILAGPVHASLGSRVAALAFYKKMVRILGDRQGKLERLDLPFYMRGYFWGWRNELRHKWAILNINAQLIRWVAGEEARLVWKKELQARPDA